LNRNRKCFEKRALVQFAAATLCCALVASAALFHIHVRTRVTEEGYRLSRLSAEHQKLSREQERLEVQVAQLTSPQRLAELSRARLKMGPPAGDRVVVLADRTPDERALPAAGGGHRPEHRKTTRLLAAQ
jgi:cell division protein FtsL